jgi:hypothetical protein
MSSERFDAAFRSFRSATGVMLLSVVAACGSDSPAAPNTSPSGSSGGGNALGVGMMRATIDGVGWTGRINVAAIATGNFLVMTGETDFGTPNQMLLSLSTPARVGTETAASGLVVGTLVTVPPVNWVSAVPGGSGTVTVSTLTATSATGTFSFVMPPGNGTTTTRVVTAGEFNVRIPTP